VYLSWFKERGLDFPIQPKYAIMIADDNDELVGGACVYVSDGPWMMIDHMSFKPGLANSVIVRGLRLGMESAKAYGAFMAKWPLVRTNRKSINLALKKCGYMKSDVECWYAEPTAKGSPREDDGFSRASRRDEKDLTEQNNNSVTEEKKKIKRVSARRNAKAVDSRASSGDERDSESQGKSLPQGQV
jgi:hypothetical protein